VTLREARSSNTQARRKHEVRMTNDVQTPGFVIRASDFLRAWVFRASGFPRQAGSLSYGACGSGKGEGLMVGVCGPKEVG
jgi:hypothetical protein